MLSEPSTTASSSRSKVEAGGIVNSRRGRTAYYLLATSKQMVGVRPDLDFLKWRRKLHGCDLRRFDPHRFLQVVGKKTIAFVGDSLARNHMESLTCLLSKGHHGVYGKHRNKGSVFVSLARQGGVKTAEHVSLWTAPRPGLHLTV